MAEMIPDDTPKGRGPSEADRDSYAGDAAWSLAKEKLLAEADAKLVVARTGWILATVFGVAFGLTLVSKVKTDLAWAQFRYPFVWANAGGNLMLVSNAKAGTWESIPQNVVQGEIRRFLDMRFGVSSYHRRKFWGPLRTYWLTQPQNQAFLNEMRPIFDRLQHEGMERQIRVRVVQIEDSKPIDGGGTRYMAQVEFVAMDLMPAEVTAPPERTQAFRVKLEFSMGTPYGESDPGAIQLWGEHNPSAFRIYNDFKAEPIEINTLIAPVAGRTLPQGVPEASAPSSNAPVIPAHQ